MSKKDSVLLHYFKENTLRVFETVSGDHASNFCVLYKKVSQIFMDILLRIFKSSGTEV